MTEEQKAAFIIAMSVSALAEIEATKAANWMREMQGHTIAYGEDEFIAIPDKYGLGHNAVLSIFHD